VGSHPTIQANPQFFHALGEIKTAQLEFLGYTVPDQAFSEQNPHYAFLSISISVIVL
jgi:hypothetical protein